MSKTNIVLTLAMIMTAVWACNDQPKVDSAPQAMATTPKNTISLADAKLYTQGWQDTICNSTLFRETNIFAFEITKDDIADMNDAIQNQGAVAVRAYLGYRSVPPAGESQFELIFVGVDANGKDQTGTGHYLWDFTQPCPDLCDTTSALYNSCIK